MPVVMDMRWEGVSVEKYEAARSLVKWETDVPNGALFHVARFDGDTIYVMDLWESEDAWNAFLQNRLMPGIAQIGIEGEPKVVLRPAYAVFAPGYSVTLPEQKASAPA